MKKKEKYFFISILVAIIAIFCIVLLYNPTSSIKTFCKLHNLTVKKILNAYTCEFKNNILIGTPESIKNAILLCKEGKMICNNYNITYSNLNIEKEIRDPNIKIILFYSKYCPHCKEAKPIIENICKEYNVTLIKIEISDKKNNKYFDKYCLSRNITECGVPFIIIGNYTFIGFIKS